MVLLTGYFLLTHLPIGFIYAKDVMTVRVQNKKDLDPIRRIFLRRCGAFFLAFASNLSFPSLCHAAWKLVVPIPKRPLLPNRSRSFRPKVAVVIDDIGNSVRLAREFLRIPVPLTFSILPLRPFSRQLMQEITCSGHEVLLHQPMEPFRRDVDPGPGAVYTSFSAARIQDTISSNLVQIHAAKGVNNHMGSKFTADREKIEEALEVIKQNGLFFIDSLTTPHSVAYKTAIGLRISAGQRNVFLDCHPGLEGTVREMKRLVAVARHWGKAIGIGHPFVSTLRGIKEFLSLHSRLCAQIEFVPVSRVVIDAK